MNPFFNDTVKLGWVKGEVLKEDRLGILKKIETTGGRSVQPRFSDGAGQILGGSIGILTRENRAGAVRHAPNISLANTTILTLIHTSLGIFFRLFITCFELIVSLDVHLDMAFDISDSSPLSCSHPIPQHRTKRRQEHVYS